MMLSFCNYILVVELQDNIMHMCNKPFRETKKHNAVFKP